MTGGGKSTLDEAESYKRKLQALEGDKVAYTERLTATITNNKTAIGNLREENKEMEKRLRSLKNQPKAKHGAGLGPDAIEHLDHKVCTAVKKHNAIRAEAERKELEMAKLQEQMLGVTVQANYLKSNKEGQSAESLTIRDLENQLQKSNDKYGDAVYMTKTYGKIIDKLNLDRLEFDNTLLGLEGTVSETSEEMKQLETLCADAERARDATKAELAECDRQASNDREKRDLAKKELNHAAEEQQRKYEAMERMMKSSHGDRTSGAGKEEDSSIAEQLQTSEGMMRRIQEATGVMNVQEVLERFKSQKETETKLTALKEESTLVLADLKTSLEALEKKYEALKYSGEARNTSNQRMVSEFEQHLTTAEKAVETHQTDLRRNETLLVRVRTGIDHLHDKLETLKPVQFRAAVHTEDKLTESKLRLEQLMEELEQRKTELAEVGDEMPMILPENNVRIRFASPAGDGKDDEEDDELNADNEAISRDQIKRQAQILVDQNAAAPGAAKGKKKR